MWEGNAYRDIPTEALEALVVPLDRELPMLKRKVDALPLVVMVRRSMW